MQNLANKYESDKLGAKFKLLADLIAQSTDLNSDLLKLEFTQLINQYQEYKAQNPQLINYLIQLISLDNLILNEEDLLLKLVPSWHAARGIIFSAEITIDDFYMQYQWIELIALLMNINPQVNLGYLTKISLILNRYQKYKTLYTAINKLNNIRVDTKYTF